MEWEFQFFQINVIKVFGDASTGAMICATIKKCRFTAVFLLAHIYVLKQDQLNNLKDRFSTMRLDNERIENYSKELHAQDQHLVMTEKNLETEIAATGKCLFPVPSYF